MDERELLGSIGYQLKDWTDDGNGSGSKGAKALLERLTYLGERPSVDELFRVLGEARPPESPLERQWLREQLVSALRGKVNAPASVVDAWLGVSDGRREDQQGRALELSDPEPWPEAVDGAELLSELAGLFRRYVVLPDPATGALSLWVLHAYALDAFAISPILVITSPTKRCGKTNAMRVLALVAPRPLLSSNVSAAALFRTVEAARPTLLMDEADTFVKLSEEHRGLLNAGHTRDAAQVVRTVGENHEPRVFSTWCPKAVAAIGRLPGTIEDRAIVVTMRRRTVDEPVDRLRPDRIRAEAEVLRRKARRWAGDHLERLRGLEPEPVPGLNDRAQDNWLPLLAVAEVADGSWRQRARAAAVELSGGIEEDSVGVLLLQDLASIFAERQVDRLTTQEVLKALHGLEERPWGDWRQGRPLSAEQLARILKDFGVRPRPFPKGKVRGYRLEDGLQEAIRRYLPPLDPSPRHAEGVTEGQTTPGEPANPSPTHGPGDGSQGTERGRRTGETTTR